MSIEDRLLLNRLILGGQHTIQVMMLSEKANFDRLLVLNRRLQGREVFIDRRVGYARVELPIEHLADLITSSLIDAYHIASLARASAAREALPRENAEAWQNALGNPTIRSPLMPDMNLPLLTKAASEEPGYTGDEDMGVDRWLHEHPTFDGRGVTIALIDMGLPDFSHPIFGPAKTLDGRPIEKIAGIVNALDTTEYDQTRVELTRTINAVGTWVWITNRFFILPHAGKYQFGFLELNAGDNLTQQIGVLRSSSTGEIWVDTNGDADFRSEQPVVGLECIFRANVNAESGPS